MKIHNCFSLLTLLISITSVTTGLAGQAAEVEMGPTNGRPFALLAVPNQPPQIEIVFPPDDVVFRLGGELEIHARAFDPDGSISQVQFFADTNLIGTVTNSPYNFIWKFNVGGVLTAVVVDNLAATNISAPVLVKAYQSGGQTSFGILSPTNNTVLVGSSTFEYVGKLYASGGYAFPALFFIGTNLVATVNDPPYATTVTNLAAGEYVLQIGMGNPDKPFWVSGSGRITVLKLALETPRLSSDVGFEFLLDGTLAGKSNVIETSSDLVTWLPISTNVPSTNSFLFVDSAATNSPARFYRVKLLP